MKDQCPFVMPSGRRCNLEIWHLHYPAWVSIDDRGTRALLAYWPKRKKRYFIP